MAKIWGFHRIEVNTRRMRFRLEEICKLTIVNKLRQIIAIAIVHGGLRVQRSEGIQIPNDETKEEIWQRGRSIIPLRDQQQNIRSSNKEESKVSEIVYWNLQAKTCRSQGDREDNHDPLQNRQQRRKR